MITLSRNQQFIVFMGLLLILSATRLSQHILDASIAVFFIGGFFLRSGFYMAGFMIAAGLIDYMAFQNGVSNWCAIAANGSIRIGYFFLIPTYAIMWGAGYFYFKRHQVNFKSLSHLTLLLLFATFIAFSISTVSHYAFSDAVSTEGGILGHLGRLYNNHFSHVIGYFTTTMMYVGLATLITLVAISRRLGKGITNSR